MGLAVVKEAENLKGGTSPHFEKMGIQVYNLASGVGGWGSGSS